VPGAIRYYRGAAPRYPVNCTFLSQYVNVPTYAGELLRVVTNYYRGSPVPGSGPADETESLRRVELTTVYDDPLKTAVMNVNDPAAWNAFQLNVEIRDPLQFSVSDTSRPEGFATFKVAGAFNASNLSMIYEPFPAWKDTTESGNLVGQPRRIQGRYNGNVPRWA